MFLNTTVKKTKTETIKKNPEETLNGLEVCTEGTEETLRDLEVCTE